MCSKFIFTQSGSHLGPLKIPIFNCISSQFRQNLALKPHTFNFKTILISNFPLF